LRLRFKKGEVARFSVSTETKIPGMEALAKSLSATSGLITLTCTSVKDDKFGLTARLGIKGPDGTAKPSTENLTLDSRGRLVAATAAGATAGGMSSAVLPKEPVIIGSKWVETMDNPIRDTLPAELRNIASKQITAKNRVVGKRIVLGREGLVIRTTFNTDLDKGASGFGGGKVSSVGTYVIDVKNGQSLGTDVVTTVEFAPLGSQTSAPGKAMRIVNTTKLKRTK